MGFNPNAHGNYSQGGFQGKGPRGNRLPKQRPSQRHRQPSKSSGSATMGVKVAAFALLALGVSMVLGPVFYIVLA